MGKKIPITIDLLHKSDDEIFAQIRSLIKQTFSNPSNIVVSQISGGTTNRLYRVHLSNEIASDFTCLCRVNGVGTEKIIDRDHEQEILMKLSKQSIGPKIYSTFRNGMVYEYFKGRPLGPTELKDHAEQIAKKMAKFHLTDVEDGERIAKLFPMVRGWMKEVKEIEFTEEAKKSKFATFDLNRLEKYIDAFERAAKDFPIAFCHNDLLALNIIYDGDAEDYKFIDYEYCCFNLRSFDIGNHFCEYIGFEMEYSRFPDEAQQRKFLTAYLKAFNQTDTITEDELEEFVKEVQICVLFANLFWSVWGLFQARYSVIEFDYLGYSEGRLRWMEELREKFGIAPLV